MPTEEQRSGSFNNQQVAVLNQDGLRQDIKELAVEMRTGFGKVHEALFEMSNRLTKLETQQQRVEKLDQEFKEHVTLMSPIRDEVIGIRKLGKVALTTAGFLPFILTALVAIWHPWQDDTRTQLAPISRQLQDLADKERSDTSDINSKITDQTYKITTLQTEVTPQPSVAVKRTR
jgi:hypothetical protein